MMTTARLEKPRDGRRGLRMPRWILGLMLLTAMPAVAAVAIAHRGDSIHHPDNTVAAIQGAWKAGADVVELDVRLSADGVLILFHDPEIKGRRVKDLTHAQLNELTPAYEVPTLEQALLAAVSGKSLLLDLKESSEPYLDQVLKQVQSSTISGVKVMLQSTNMEALAYLRKQAPADMPLLLVTDLKGIDTQEKAEQLAARLVESRLQGVTAQGRQHVDAAFVGAFRKSGLRYLVWTINEPERMRHYAGLGVDGVITDDPAAFRKLFPAEKPAKVLPLPGELFVVDGHEAFVIRPAGQVQGPTPWVWYAPTLPRLPGKEETWMFEHFIAKGIAIAGIDVGESFGSPGGTKAYQAFYEEMTNKRGLAAKPCLLARSRGGLMLYNWAVEHPQCVSGIVGIYPVCNLSSYPGLAKACGAYGLTEKELEARLADHNPVERLAPLAKVGVPILHLHGDNDKVVPLEVNSELLKTKYQNLGGSMALAVIKGGGHDLKAHWFKNQRVVDFVSFHLVGVQGDDELRKRVLEYLAEDSWTIEK